MAPISSVRVATCVVAAALVGAAAATLPAEARAEDGSASASDTAATMPAIDGSVLAGEASAAVESAMTNALGGAAQADDPVSAAQAVDPASSTDAGTDAPASPAPSASDVTTSMPDTRVDSADTTTDIANPTPLAPAPAPQATSSAAQTAPSNVNVSVRIGSAGDTGPVTQVNVAAASSVAATATGTSSPVATAASVPTRSAQPSPAVSAPATPSSSPSQDDPGTWTWQWNCLSAPDLTAISPSGSANGSTPKNWTWIWNCGSNPAQYQDATSSQYQPSNVNVSIRISSPGNDGPVTQANIAAALGVATGTSIVAAAVHASIAPVVTSPQPGAPAVTLSGLPSLPALPGLPSLPEFAVPTGVALAIGDATGVTIVPSEVSIFDMVELPFALPPLSGARRPGLGGLVQRLPRLAGPGGAAWFAPVMIPSDARDGGGAVLAEATSGPSSSKDAAGHREREKPAPRWKAPAPPQPLAASVSSGTSVAPASGGGSSGSGIPIFLALPFLAAMLDLARRVTLDRVALPSGHRSRMPENPG